jgi:hypothetical protein
MTPCIPVEKTDVSEQYVASIFLGSKSGRSKQQRYTNPFGILQRIVGPPRVRGTAKICVQTCMEVIRDYINDRPKVFSIENIVT